MSGIIAFIAAHLSATSILGAIAAVSALLAGLFHVRATKANSRAGAAEDRAVQAEGTVAAMKRVNDAVEKTEQQQRKDEQDAPRDDGRTGLDNNWPK